MKKLLHIFYLFFVLVIWLFVACLALEVGARVFFWGAGYLYNSYFEKQNSKVYRVVKMSEELQRVENKKETSTPSQETVENTTPLTSDPSVVVYNDYPCGKDYELTLEGVVEAHFDKRGNLIESHGDPIFERHLLNRLQGIEYGYFDLSWSTLLKAIQSPPAEPLSLQLKYDDIFSHQYNVQVYTKGEQTVVLAKENRNGYPLSLKTIGLPVKEDSPWIVFQFMYKPHYKAPGLIPNTNNFGFRDEDVIVPKPKGVLRIVCVGGSTTEEGNDTQSTYPNIMERKLRNYFNTDKIDVVNCGICGGRSFSECRRINDYLQLEPDLLVYYNAINDICYHYMPVWLSLPNPYKKIFSKSTFLNHLFNEKLLPSDEYIAEYLRGTILRNLGAMNCACKKRGVQMAICSFAYPRLKWYQIMGKLYCDFNIRNLWLRGQEIDISYSTYKYVMNIYNRELKKLCEEEGILYIPVAEEFQAGLDHFSDVCHMTPVGLDTKTDIIGSHIARWIESQKNLSLSTP